MVTRSPVVSGMFYPQQKSGLLESIKSCYLHDQGPGQLPSPEKEEKKLLGLVVPHAGFIYSGPIAAHSYLHLSQSKRPEAIILVGLTHRFSKTDAALYSGEGWETPLGVYPIDLELVNELEEKTIAEIDNMAHQSEHSLEVQIPFLQQIYGEEPVPFAAITLRDQTPETAQLLGKQIAEVIGSRNICVIASTDFTHQESYETAYKQDKLVLEQILAGSADKVYEVVRENKITMCGYGPVQTLLKATETRKNNILQLKYATSGDTAGDKQQVVGYASFAIY
ncbi:MAG: AmmeMemoRadiSam system protein B [Candidatus Kariarchaeaceae archaeon]